MPTTPAERRRAPRTVASVLEAWRHEPLDGNTAHWVTVTSGGRPCARVRIPVVGTVGAPAFWDLAIGRHARVHAARTAAETSLLRRFGGDGVDGAAEPVTISVVVCTHRRPDDLARFLAATGRLDPSPHEVIVVDNDPGAADVRAVVEAAGAVYVREDRRGLDRARIAGIEAARGEVVCFTDDDCEPPLGWLSPVAEHFSDPSVGALTGPGFAAELETRPQIRFEQAGGFTRGLEPRRADWTEVAPVDAISLGAGACMAFRREHLVAVAAPFPAELDAGTRTQSGGDHIALYSVLASGRRLAYDPRFYVLHRHRRDWAAMHRAFWGYGVGLSAALTRLLIREREPRAVWSAGWPLRQYVAEQARRAVGRADAVDTRIAWDYLRGAACGPGRWLRSWPPDHAPIGPSPGGSPTVAYAANVASGVSRISVIVTTRARPDALERCLGALAAQVGDTPFDVVVCDDDPAESARPLVWRDGWQMVRTGGCGAAGARNRGAARAAAPRLLFLDDDLVPAPDLVARHDRGLEDEDLVLVGRCHPAPRTSNLVTSQAVLWWTDYYRDRARVLGVTFRDVLSGNMSISRASFNRLGGFDEGFGAARREDWEWGIRVLREGLRVGYDPAACAPHEFALTSRRMLDACWRDGRGDRILLTRASEAAAALPRWKLGWLTPVGRLSTLALAPAAGRAVCAGVLDGLERCRMRGTWAQLMRAAQGAAYWAGRGSHVAPAAPVAVLELSGDAPVPAPAVAAPDVQVTLDGEPVGRLTPDEGRWGPHVVSQIVEAGGRAWLGRVARDMIPEPQGEHGMAVDSLVWDDGRPWSEVARRVAASEADVVVIGLGTPMSSPDLVAYAFLAERVGVLVGAASGGVSDSGLVLADRVDRGLFAEPITYLALRPRLYRALPAHGRRLERFGPGAVALHTAVVACGAGALSGRLDVHIAARPHPSPSRLGVSGRVAVALARPESAGRRVQLVGDALVPDPLPGARRVAAALMAGAAVASAGRRVRRR